MKDLDKRVLEEIGRRRLSPRPYAYFLARRSVLWSLAVLSVLLGAISVAVILFAVTDMHATGGRRLEEMPLDDVLTILPYAWIAMLALFLSSAIYSVRQTPRGYRYRSLHLAAAAIVASLAIGGLMHLTNAGARTHDLLLQHVPLYRHLVRSNELRQNEPAAGFLVGRVVTVDGPEAITILDFDGRTWTVDLDGAQMLNDATAGEEDLAIEGTITGPSSFKATLVRDWDGD